MGLTHCQILVFNYKRQTDHCLRNGYDGVISLVIVDELISWGRAGKRWNEYPQWMQAEVMVSSRGHRVQRVDWYQNLWWGDPDELTEAGLLSEAAPSLFYYHLCTHRSVIVWKLKTNAKVYDLLKGRELKLFISSRISWNHNVPRTLHWFILWVNWMSIKADLDGIQPKLPI